MKKIFFLCIFIVLFLLNMSIAAQSNEQMDEFLARSYADLGMSSYLVLASAGRIDESASVEEALNWVSEQGMDASFKNLEADRDICYGEFSYILMEALSLKGGVMYRIFPGPRYAAREAAYKKWMLGRSSPSRSLRPYEVINAINMVMEELEERS